MVIAWFSSMSSSVAEKAVASRNSPIAVYASAPSCADFAPSLIAAIRLVRYFGGSNGSMRSQADRLQNKLDPEQAAGATAHTARRDRRLLAVGDCSEQPPSMPFALQDYNAIRQAMDGKLLRADLERRAI